MDSSISNGEVFPCDFEIFRKDRISDNPGGGIFIAIHNTILATHQPKLDSNSEAIWVKLEFVKQKPLYLASVYRPPGSQEGALNELENSLLSLQSNGSYLRVILTGDFNVPVPDVDYFGSNRNNTDYNTTAHVLLQYRSATYTTFLPSLKYTLIQTGWKKTKSKHLNASKCLRTSFVAEEIIRTNSETKSKTSTNRPAK